MGKEKDYERFLTNAEIVSVKDVGSGVNQPKRITLRQGAREIDALWKPIQRGPKEWAWESFEAEVAAYQLDRILGLHMVPPTVVRSIQGQEGSLQLWVTGVKFFRDTSAGAPQTEEWDQQLARCRLFDNLIANGDRSSTNILVDEEWNLVLIDHSQAFLSSHYLEDDDEKLPHKFDRQLVARLEDLGPGIHAVSIRPSAAHSTDRGHHHAAQRLDATARQAGRGERRRSRPVRSCVGAPMTSGSSTLTGQAFKGE